MNKKVLFLSIILLTLCLITIVIFNSMSNDENNIIFNINKDEQVISGNMITMMYETEAGSGEYTETLDNTWPETGYIFNESLSGCENGGELEYNSGNNTVNLLSNSSDRCYVYFDKYDGVWIDNISITNVTGSSVTLDVSATSENGNITTYYYSLNDNEYVSTSSNPIVIENLNQLTEYNIKIYAIDNTGASSNIYELNVSTVEDIKPEINYVLVNDITTNSISISVNSENDITNYYYSINNNNYVSSNNNTYTFSNLRSNTTNYIKVYITDVNGVESNVYNLAVNTRLILLVDYLKNLFVTQGSNNLYYHISTLANGAGDNSYRYSGANPNNYVCFGSTSSPCPDNNLYRIIGIFDDEIKLIKNSSYGNYSWNSTYSNDWSTSSLNSRLNSTYLNSFDSSWSDLIMVHTWKIGGMWNRSSYDAKEYYDIEVGDSSSTTTHDAKIGLMYVSDYAYAASNNYWTTELGSYSNARNNNWLVLGANEWTISPISSESYHSFYIISSGTLLGGVIYTVTGSYAVRPCFYLDSGVAYESGIGTQSDPYRIGI